MGEYPARTGAPKGGGERVFVIAFENVAYNYGGGELLSDISLRLPPDRSIS